MMCAPFCVSLWFIMKPSGGQKILMGCSRGSRKTMTPAVPCSPCSCIRAALHYLQEAFGRTLASRGCLIVCKQTSVRGAARLKRRCTDSGSADAMRICALLWMLSDRETSSQMVCRHAWRAAVLFLQTLRVVTALGCRRPTSFKSTSWRSTLWLPKSSLTRDLERRFGSLSRNANICRLTPFLELLYRLLGKRGLLLCLYTSHPSQGPVALFLCFLYNLLFLNSRLPSHGFFPVTGPLRRILLAGASQSLALL